MDRKQILRASIMFSIVKRDDASYLTAVVRVYIRFRTIEAIENYDLLKNRLVVPRAHSTKPCSEVNFPSGFF